MAPRVVILPPVPVPYREPLFRALVARPAIDARVVYLSGSQPGWDQPPDWFAARDGYPSEVLGAIQRARPGRSPLALPRGLGHALARLDPACVVSWEFGPATGRALAWCRRRRRPLVVFSELTPWSDAQLSGVRLRVHRALAPRIPGFLVASTQGAERLRGLGVDPRRIEVALQAADLDRLALRRPAAAPPPVRLLAVGRLVPDKNLELLIDAFAEAGFEPGEAELVLHGTGPLEGALRARAERIGGAVRVAGPAPSAELPGLYARAHVAVLVSTYEPFGVTMREAAAAGLALVCTRRAGAAGDVAVEEENALLVDPGARSEVSEALRRLVREPGLRERLAAGSRAVTERHPLERDVEAWERAILRPLTRTG